MLKIITAKDAGQADVKTRQVLLDLYSRNAWGSILGETVYSDNERNAQPIISPNLALLGDTTPVNFYESVSLGLIGEGFIPRFFIIEYEGMRPRINKNIVSLASEELLTKCATLAQTVLNMYAQNQHLNINYEESAKAILDNFNDFCDTQINIPQDDSLAQARAQIWNRAHLNALRLAGILAVGNNPFNPVVSEADANWAVNMTTRSVYSIQRRIDAGAFGKGTAAKKDTMMECIRGYYNSDFVDQELSNSRDPNQKAFWNLVKSKSLIPYAYIHNKLQSDPLFENSTRGSAQEISVMLQTFVQLGYLRQLDAKELSGIERRIVKSDMHIYAPGNLFGEIINGVSGYIPMLERNGESANANA
jgi:hypothetical protein